MEAPGLDFGGSGLQFWRFQASIVILPNGFSDVSKKPLLHSCLLLIRFPHLATQLDKRGADPKNAKNGRESQNAKNPCPPCFSAFALPKKRGGGGGPPLGVFNGIGAKLAFKASF